MLSKVHQQAVFLSLRLLQEAAFPSGDETKCYINRNSVHVGQRPHHHIHTEQQGRAELKDIEEVWSFSPLQNEGHLCVYLLREPPAAFTGLCTSRTNKGRTVSTVKLRSQQLCEWFPTVRSRLPKMGGRLGSSQQVVCSPSEDLLDTVLEHWGQKEARSPFPFSLLCDFSWRPDRPWEHIKNLEPIPVHEQVHGLGATYRSTCHPQITAPQYE